MGYETVKGTNHNLNILIGNEPHWVRLHEPEATDEQVAQINGKESANASMVAGQGLQ